jgi:MFS transporter, DHA1 family, tetracycline resistance protein
MSMDEADTPSRKGGAPGDRGAGHSATGSGSGSGSASGSGPGSGPSTAPGPGRGVLGTLFLVVFVDLVGFGMIVTLLPRYGEMYHPSPAMLGIFMSTYSLFQFVFAPILGRLSDRFGRRPVMLVSLLGAAAGYLLLGVGGTMAMLFLARAVAGACAGNIATAQAVIADTTGPEGRARGMGIIGAAFGLGFIIGPAAGGLLFRVAPWLPGVAASITSLAAFVLVLLLMPETRVLRAEERDVRAPVGWNSLKAAIKHVRRFGAALAHPLLGLCLAAFFMVVFGFANFESSFVLFSEKKFALDAAATGWIFLFVGVIGALVQGGLIGPLTKRFGEPRLLVTGMLCSFLALGFLPYMPTVAAVVAALGLLALGTGLVNPSLSSLTSRLVDADEVGGVLGIYQSMGSLGRIAGPFVGVSALFDIGLAWPFRIASTMMLLSAGLAAVLLFRLDARRAPAGTPGPR